MTKLWEREIAEVSTRLRFGRSSPRVPSIAARGALLAGPLDVRTLQTTSIARLAANPERTD